MATASLSLGEHWETFIKNEIASGRYGFASEVVRDALRGMEERESKFEALRVYLKEGAEQAQCGEFVKNYAIDKLIEELDAEECPLPSKLLHVRRKTSKTL
ncbi:MAG: type II toxin-antitoxin system ParD family antitoxin [Nitrosomonas sp.]|nr:type II toxin-antitoxin system ParD family antitoxin [Nitrosomonas sp.]